LPSRSNEGFLTGVCSRPVVRSEAETMAWSQGVETEKQETVGVFVTDIDNAKIAFTIHPPVIEFKGRRYFFYHHDGSTSLNGMPGAMLTMRKHGTHPLPKLLVKTHKETVTP
jgi:hypothetical protein